MRATSLVLVLAFSASAAHKPLRVDPGGLLGTGQTSIQAMATDPTGNLYVVGTTSSPDLPVKDAAQPAFGDTRVLVTRDLGTTWNPAGSPPDASVIAPDPVSPQVLFASGSKGIYKSTDQGRTWRQTYRFETSGFFSGALAIDPANHLRVAALSPSSATLILSLDGGETWTPGAVPCPISSCGGGQQLLADPTGSGALLLVSFGVSLSRDWGLTFQLLSPPGFGSATAAAFDPSHRGWMYVDTAAGVMGSLFLSTDFGATWTRKTSPPTTFSAMSNLAVAPDQPSTLIATTADGLYKSTDAALSWTRQSGPPSSFSPEGHFPFVLPGPSCSPGGGLFAIGSGPGYFQVAFSPDDGITWNTPQLSHVNSLSAGPGCAVYVTREITTDGFVAKLDPDGAVLWATYLGGSDQDAPVGLTIDTEGNAYVTGNTTSPDFPSTAPRIGMPGQSSVFVTKLSASGKITYSTLAGGESANTAIGIAVDGHQNVFITGRTNSQTFPVTSGVLVPKLDPGSYNGFLVKLSPDAGLVSGTYLGGFSPAAIATDPNGQPVIAGAGDVPGQPPSPLGNGTLQSAIRLDSSLSRVVSSFALAPGDGSQSGALAIDPEGNVLVATPADPSTVQTTPGAYRTPTPVSLCVETSPYFYSAGAVLVTKLNAADWKPVYSALLSSPCGAPIGTMALDSTGAPVLALATGSGFPLRHPVLAGATCFANSSLIAKLSSNGATLDFATYVDSCGTPGIAVAGDGSVYVGVSALQSGVPAAVLRLATPHGPAGGINRIENAFSGDASVVVAGGLYAIELDDQSLPAIDLGLNAPQSLPLVLGGIQVKFDGIPAPLLQIGPGRVVAAAPADLRARVRDGSHLFTAVQVITGGVSSEKVWMPVSTSKPGLLTRDFPNLTAHADFAEGNIRNEDGTLNDSEHPAAPGSKITVFATGMGVDFPRTSVYASWVRASPGNVPPPLAVNSAPGLIPAVDQIQIQVPDSSENLGGTMLPGGVRRVALGLQFTANLTYNVVASNLVAVYLR